MKQGPVFSICIPIYNGARFIRRALDTSLRQTYENIEVVVADDASTDETALIVKEYAEKDSRVRYHLNEKNLGLAPNFLRSFEYSTGDYVQHLGCDDWLDKDYAKRKVELFEQYPDAAFISCGVARYMKNENGEYIEQSRDALHPGRYTGEFTFQNFYKTGGLMSTTATTRRADMLKHFMAVVPNDWDYDAFYRKGKIIDNMGYLNILADYKYFYYIDDVFYNSLDHEAEASKHFGFSRTDIADEIKFVHVDAVGYEYFFKTKAPAYLSKFRVFMGVNVLATTIFNLLLRRATGKPGPMLRKFFRDYRFSEKASVVAKLPFRLATRVFEWLARRV